MQTRNEKIVGESQSKLKNLDLFCKRFGDYLTKQIYADVTNFTSNKKIYVCLTPLLNPKEVYTNKDDNVH